MNYAAAPFFCLLQCALPAWEAPHGVDNFCLSKVRFQACFTNIAFDEKTTPGILPLQSSVLFCLRLSVQPSAFSVSAVRVQLPGFDTRTQFLPQRFAS